MHRNPTNTSDRNPQPTRHFVVLFTVMGVAIPLTVITLIAGIILLITNCRSYRNDQRLRWPQNKRPQSGLHRPAENCNTKRYLADTDCERSLVPSTNIKNKKLFYTGLLNSPKSDHATSQTGLDPWHETLRNKKPTTFVSREHPFGYRRSEKNKTEWNDEGEPKNGATALFKLIDNPTGTESPRCQYSCIHATHAMHSTVICQMPYIDQSVINTLTLLSSPRTSSPPPPYEQGEQFVEAPYNHCYSNS
ncbi:unnamed protein product [Echinostoma caproni]|uniref:Protein ORF6 n=1 Tax=Echinostoma caproni TaxID=27848 RepID=A0A183BC28_9TREM|nr:unnamed protein product [Echinostoma caproni]